MITYLELGSGKRGNLGNQLFQVASTIGIGIKTGHKVVFNQWPYFKYFELDIMQETDFSLFVTICEPHFHYHHWNLPDGKFALDGWLQSEKYFNDGTPRIILPFRSSYLKKAKLDLEKIVRKRKTILISIRRGDFVNNPNYFQLNYKDYFFNLIGAFPKWKDYFLLVTSDDIAYCKKYLGFIKNLHFIDNKTPIEIMILSNHVENCIISNSTFSWWLAYYCDKNGGNVIRPQQNFSDSYRKKNDDRDYFPDHWNVFEKFHFLEDSMRILKKSNWYEIYYYFFYFAINGLKRKIKSKLILFRL